MYATHKFYKILKVHFHQKSLKIRIFIKQSKTRVFDENGVFHKIWVWEHGFASRAPNCVPSTKMRPEHQNASRAPHFLKSYVTGFMIID